MPVGHRSPMLNETFSFDPLSGLAKYNQQMRLCRCGIFVVKHPNSTHHPSSFASNPFFCFVISNVPLNRHRLGSRVTFTVILDIPAGRARCGGLVKWKFGARQEASGHHQLIRARPCMILLRR
jgi:hypothetical protein